MRFPGEQDLLDERAAVLVTLASLTDDEFESGPTLCAEWAPRDVLAHLMGIDGSLGEYVRAKGNIARANAEIVERGPIAIAGRADGVGRALGDPAAVDHPGERRCSCSATPRSTTRTSCGAPVGRGRCRRPVGPRSCGRALVLGPASAAALPGGARRRRSAHGSGRGRAGQLRGARACGWPGAPRSSPTSCSCSRSRAVRQVSVRPRPMRRSIEGGTPSSPRASMAARSMLISSRCTIGPLVPRPLGDAVRVALGIDAAPQVGLQGEHVVGAADRADAGDDRGGHVAEVAQRVGPGAGIAVEGVGGGAERAHRAGEQHVGRRHQQHEVLRHLPGRTAPRRRRSSATRRRRPCGRSGGW